MKTFLTLLLSCFCLLGFAQSTQGDLKPLDLVQSKQARNASFEAVSPFSVAAQRRNQVTELDENVVDYEVLNVDFQSLSRFANNA
ncbi:MAG TPA: hypothetical protein PLU64_08225, partial [Saprospiraceae bacterium]|nr:hypothetical protein [Saprospiraceae bacterium]